MNNVLILRDILVHRITEKTLLTMEIFKYERSENVDCDEQYAQIWQFKLLKYGGSLLKMKTQGMNLRK